MICIVPLEILRWLVILGILFLFIFSSNSINTLCAAAGGLSGFFLYVNLKDVIYQHAGPKSVPMIGRAPPANGSFLPADFCTLVTLVPFSRRALNPLHLDPHSVVILGMHAVLTIFLKVYFYN